MELEKEQTETKASRGKEIKILDQRWVKYKIQSDREYNLNEELVLQKNQ